MKLRKRAWWLTKERKAKRIKRRTRKERKKTKMVHLDHKLGMQNKYFQTSFCKYVYISDHRQLP